MIVAVCQIALFLPECGSLKEKRAVLNSIKMKVRQKFNISIAEVDGHEKWQKTVLGLSLVTNERKLVDRNFEKIFDLIESDGRVQVLEHRVELY